MSHGTEPPLFRLRTAAKPGPRACAASAAVVLNAAAADLRVSAAIGATGALVVAWDRARGVRVHGLAAGCAGAAAFASAAAWFGHAPEGAAAGVRALTSLPWLVALAAALTWPDVRRALGAARAPGWLVEFADTSVAQSMVFADEMRRARECMAVRNGFATRWSPAPHAAVIASGVERALDRAVVLDESRTMRSAARASAAPADAPAAELRGATVVREEGFALGPVDLVVARGEWVAVIGPSGSGKTTLLRLLAGLDAATRGEVRRFGGTVPRGGLAARVDSRLGWVGQHPADQLFAATVAEDVAWGLRRRGAADDDAERIASEALREIGLAGVATRPVHRLSFGERKRAAFAGALACGPDLLLCDEPTSGLDPVAAARLVAAVERACGPDAAVVWVTHDVAALPRRVRRVVALRDGIVAWDEPRDEALRRSRLAEAGLVAESGP